MEPIKDYISYQLISLMKTHRQQTEERLQQIGLYVGQEQILFLLCQGDGLSQSQMCSQLCLDHSTIAKTVKRMERAGLLIRRPDPEDARVSRVYLTEQGRSLYEPVLHILHDIENRMLDGMTEVERALLRRLLQHALANFS